MKHLETLYQLHYVMSIDNGQRSNSTLGSSMLNLRVNVNEDEGLESTRSSMSLSSVSVFHHFQRISHVTSEHFFLKRLELLPVGTVLTLAPGGSALPGLQSPVDRKYRR